jgi:2-keto-4-pentenoate hydratase/2-oxohepta-3-ene-1,7-dioic acid hydratase in catechol pathway
MYFLRFKYQDAINLGVMDMNKTKVVVLENLKSIIEVDGIKDMNDLVKTIKDEDVEKISKFVDQTTEFIDINDIEVLSPIEYSFRNLFCLGKNYVEHINEVKSMPNVKGNIPEHPIYFSKTCYPSIGPDDTIIIDESLTNSVDYEVELALVIGKEGKNISKENILDHIFGYTIINDISARDLQIRHGQWHRGKSLDTFTPMGPYIIHKSQVAYPVNLDIKCWINDELRQDSKTSKMIFDIDYIISDLSKSTTLYPGDIILTGTPAGVGMGFDPPKMLKDGDIVKCQIEKIGTLSNKVKCI